MAEETIAIGWTEFFHRGRLTYQCDLCGGCTTEDRETMLAHQVAAHGYVVPMVEPPLTPVEPDEAIGGKRGRRRYPGS